MYIFKHLIRKKYLFRRINKNPFMQKMINNLIIETQVFEIIHEKFNHRKKKIFIKKSR